jgi:ABC-type branched-subunit amino acid transport system substrate-binding protein
MLSNRDRLLAGLFALQLVALLVFGIVLLQGTHFTSTTTTKTVYLNGAAPPTALPTAASTHGTAATPGRTATTVIAGTTQAPAQADDSGAGTVKKGEAIKVGAIVTQTGAINFAASAQGTKAYIDLVNRAGGVNGHRIALDLRDDQLDATRGKAQAQQLLSEGVFCFLGWQAPLTEADIAPFLARNRIPLIGAYGVGAEYHSPWSYAFQSHHYGYEMGRFLGLEQQVTHPGVIFISNSSAAVNDAQVRAFTAGVASTGKKLASGDIRQVDVTQASYDDVVTAMRLNGVDGVATLIDQTAYNRLQQAFDRQSYHPVHVADPLFTDPTVVQSRSTDGTLVASDFTTIDQGGPDVQEYVRAVKAEFGSRAQISYIGQAGWLDAKIFVEALRRMGDTITRDHLLTVMNALPAGVGGDFTPQGLHFGPGNEHDINRCLALTRVRSGRLTSYKAFSCDDRSFDS